MAICGHAILGDATYEPNDEPSFTTTEKNDNDRPDRPTSERTTSRRMCLHAHRLTIPLLTENDGGELKRTFTAPDPFRWKRRRQEGEDGGDGDDGDGLNSRECVDVDGANTLDILL